ncbi:MAG: hypothetical protein AAFR17_14020, partial [Pseudomonadota bacterium]
MTDKGNTNAISGRCLLLSLFGAGIPALIIAAIGDFEGLALLGLMVIWFGAAYLLAKKCAEDEDGLMRKIFGDGSAESTPSDGSEAGWLLEERRSDIPEPAKTMSSAATSGAISRLTGKPLDHAAPAPKPAAVAKPAPAPKPAPVPEPAAAPKPAAPAPAPKAAETPAAPVGQKPTFLKAAREGGPDDLKQIKGVGPKLETMLHGMGIFHFDQIAVWTEAELAWVDDNLEGFKEELYARFAVTSVEGLWEGRPL